MGHLGYAPSPLDFQSNASTKLAYNPSGSCSEELIK